MVKVKDFFQFLRKQLGNFGIFSLVLVALEQILDEEFVCPCDYIYNILACVLFGAIPSIGCFVFTYCFMFQSKNTEDGNRGSVRCLYATLMTAVWLFLFFVDGRYLACALSDWEGVYAKNDTLGIEKWCKPTGNKTSVFESQMMTLKWISRSQVCSSVITFINEALFKTQTQWLYRIHN